MTSDAINVQRSEFIHNAEDYWTQIHEGNSDAANRKESANRKIVKQWSEAGNTVAILSPFLIHTSSAVRLAAAAYLIKTDAKDQAVWVLRKLKETEPGLISSSAGAVLRINKIY